MLNFGAFYEWVMLEMENEMCEVKLRLVYMLVFQDLTFFNQNSLTPIPFHGQVLKITYLFPLSEIPCICLNNSISEVKCRNDFQ